MVTRLEQSTESLGSTERYKQFTADCYLKIRVDKQRHPFRWEQVDATTNLFPCEIRLRNKVLEESRYLSEEKHAMVEAATALSLLAHSSQSRDTGAPYSVHPLKVTLMGIKKYKIDAVSISERLLHDVHEDTTVTLKTIQENIHPDVADRVKILSKRRGRHQRKTLKELLVEENRQQLFKSAVDTPDETEAKIDDRLQNMRTIKLKGEKKRREIIFETEEIYIPLARRMGLHDEANELEHLCLVNKSAEHEKWAGQANRYIKKFFRQNPPKQLLSEVHDVLNKRGYRVALHYRTPSPADIYRRIGELRPLSQEDMYLYVDAAQKDFGKNKYDLFDWGAQAIDIANIFNFNSERLFDRETIINALQFKREVENGLTDSLSIDVLRRRDKLRIRLTLYPHDVHIRERLSLAHLLSSTIDSKPMLKALLEQKQRFLADRLTQILHGEVESSHLVRQLEPRLTEGFIRVIGINDKKEEEPWSLKNGSTVMDYVSNITPLSWNKAVRTFVNGIEIEIPDYVLKPGDRIHIDFKGHGQYDPLWIHCFHTDKEGPRIVREKIYDRIKKLQAHKDRNALYLQEQRIKQVGKWRLRKLAGLKTLKVGVHQVMDSVQRIDRTITKEDEFFIKVGLGELTDDVLQPIVHKLSELNQNLLEISIDFETNEPGQLKAVGAITERLGINVVAGTTDDLGQSSVIILLDPKDERVVKRLVRGIRIDKHCISKGLKAIRFSTNHIGAPEKLLYLKK